ncbi:MAG: hypothetical protein ABI592_07960 [Acidobacteriota bacterium]
MLTGLAMAAAQAALAAAMALVARSLGRRFHGLEILLFAALPVALLFPAYSASRTLVPVDHVMLLPPWSATGPVLRHNPNLNDIATQIVPWGKAVRLAWKEGSLPWRNRWNGAGTPLAANPQTAAFSPFLFLTLPFPLWAAVTVAAAAKILLAFGGMRLWLGELGVSRPSAVVGALAFGLSFSVGPWLLFPLSSVLVLWPWALFAVERLRAPASRRRAGAFLVLVLCAWPLAGHPESAALGAMFAVLWLGARIACGDLPDWRPLGARVALAALVALGLTAFLLAPQALAIGASNRVRFATAFWRGLPLSWTPHGPRSPWALATILLPRLFGDAMLAPMIEGRIGPFPEVALSYFGAGSLVLALSILRPGGRRPRAELALLAPILAAIAVSTGTWPLFEVFFQIPVIRWMTPARALIWLALAGPALAAFELDRIRADSEGRPRRLLAPVLAAAALVVLALAVERRFAGLHAAAGGLESERRALILAAASIAGVGVAFLAAAWSQNARKVLPLLLGAVIAGELLHQTRRLYAFGPIAQFYPETPIVAFLRRQTPPFRIVGAGPMLFPNTNVFAGLEDIRTHDPLERLDYVDELDRSAGYPPLDYFKSIARFDEPAIFDRLNVRFLLQSAADPPRSARWRPVYSAADGIVLENRDALPRVFPADGLPPSGRLRIAGYAERTNSVSFRAAVSGGAPVPVVASFVDDGGWRAEIDSGGALPLRRAGLLLAMDLPPGEHGVRLRYLPPGALAGASVSAATALCLAAVAWLGRRRRAPGKQP